MTTRSVLVAVRLTAIACVAAACGGSSTDVVQPDDAPTVLALDWTLSRANNSVTFRTSPIVALQSRARSDVAKSGVVVTVELATGSGRVIGNTVAVTRANGRAVFTDLAVQGVGPFTLRFVAAGLAPVVSPVIAVTEPAVGLLITQEPTFLPSGASLASIMVGPRDVYGDYTLEEGVAITATIASGNGTLSGNATVATDKIGVARFSSLLLSGFGPHTIRFSAAGLPIVSSQTINIGQRAVSLGISVQPAGATSGLAFTTQPRLQLRDAAGAPVSQRNVPVSVTLQSGAGSLYGTLTLLTNDQGIVDFRDLTLAGTSAHTLRFDSPGLAGATSDALTLPPFELAFGLDQFALIRAGAFDMGSNFGFGNERPIHRVTISRDFYLQKTEVTQAQWGAVMGRNPSLFITCGGNCPVERVSYADVQEFIRRLNVANPGVTFRLPTEAEWEYAARAGGNGDDTTTANTQGWHAGNSQSRTQQVAKRAPNAWGLYDMVGNVWEWMSDWYDEYPASGVTNPTGPASGTQKVQRGGSWNTPAALMRIPARQFSAPDDPEFAVRSSLGLRLARTP